MEEIGSQYKAQSQALLGAKSELRKLTLTSDIRLNIVEQRVKAQEAELRRLADLKSKYTIRAPFPGFVTRKTAERGDWVTRGMQVAEVVQLDPIELRINVPQEYVGKLQQSFDLATESSPSMANVTVDSMVGTFDGTITKIIPQADERTRAVPVVIRIRNPKTKRGYLLKPGLLARASLAVGPIRKTLMVNKDALVLGNNKITVFVVDQSQSNPTVRGVEVKTGTSQGNLIEIIGQIRQGDTVVLQGNERLRTGQQVKIIK
jgi:RND family efflux transporter MFP subunit